MSVLLGMDQQIIDDTIMSGIEAQPSLFASGSDPIILGRIGSLEVRLANSATQSKRRRNCAFASSSKKWAPARKPSKKLN